SHRDPFIGRGERSLSSSRCYLGNSGAERPSQFGRRDAGRENSFASSPKGQGHRIWPGALFSFSPQAVEKVGMGRSPPARTGESEPAERPLVTLIGANRIKPISR